MNQLSLKKNINPDALIYLLLLILVIIFRYLVLINFGYAYTDSDQTIMWYGLKEYAASIFNEPRFYGQSYNSMLEAFVAVPLYKQGMPAHTALPLVTSIFTLTPYVIISLFTFLKKSTKMALVILSIPLLLPVEYSLITTIPRGFVSGLFIAGFGCISMFYPKSRWSFFLLSFTGMLGFSINFNSVLLFLPCVAYLFLENIKNKAFYLYSFASISLGLGIHLWVQYFYVINPFYDFHKIDLFYSFKTLITSVKKLDIFFNDVTPIFWKTGFLVLFMFVFIGVLLVRKKEYKEALPIIGIPVFILFALGIGKVHDGTLKIFYPYSRMYLAVPVLLATSLSFFKIKNNNLFYAYLILPVTFFIVQITTLNSAIKESLLPANDDKVAVATVDRFTDKCSHLQYICHIRHIDLVVVINHPDCDFYNYGCTAFMPNFPKTLRPSYERRTWRLLEDENKVYTNILIIDVLRNPFTDNDIIQKIPDEEAMFMIKNNTKRTMDLFNEQHIFYRPYK